MITYSVFRLAARRTGFSARVSQLESAPVSEKRVALEPFPLALAHGVGSNSLFSRASSPVRVFRRERDLLYLEIVAYQGFSDEFLHCFRRVSQLDGSACGRALLLRRTVAIADVLEANSFASYRGVAERAGFRSV